MARPKAVEPTERVYFHMPQSLYAKVKLALFSELESRVPYGAWAELICPLLHERFTYKTLDLAPYLGKPPGTFLIKGDPTVLASLETHLKELQHATALS